MPNIINVSDASWPEWPIGIDTEGYSLSEKETVQDAIDSFKKRFGYEPDTVWVLGRQVRIERRRE